MVSARLVSNVFIVGAKRTPFGTFGGKFINKSCVDLQEVASKAALTAANVNPEIVDSVCIGNIISCASNDAAYVARHVGLRVGVPVEKPALAVNRLCGSGFQAVINAAQEIMLGESEVVLAGGTENMTQAPFLMRNTRFGTRLGQTPQVDCALWGALTDNHIKLPMGITAENLAKKYSLTREQTDQFAYGSQMKWKKAQESGYFDAEITPVEVKERKGLEMVSVDEHPKPNTTLEQLAKLPPVFDKNGTVTAGSASGVGDGAGAMIVVSEAALKQHNLTPLVRVAGYSVAGCDPKIMGIGPVPAIRALLQKADMKLDDIDLVEINEAFAPQTLACAVELGLDQSKLNMCGGGIAVAHPLAASGARITAHLTHELRMHGRKETNEEHLRAQLAEMDEQELSEPRMAAFQQAKVEAFQEALADALLKRKVEMGFQVKLPTTTAPPRGAYVGADGEDGQGGPGGGGLYIPGYPKEIVHVDVLVKEPDPLPEEPEEEEGHQSVKRMTARKEELSQHGKAIEYESRNEGNHLSGAWVVTMAACVKESAGASGLPASEVDKGLLCSWRLADQVIAFKPFNVRSGEIQLGNLSKML
ncbi:unnamed protein product [Cyprideis torosa]|uniref:Uncharacterized protein n=1 Tax=Cyprideis torosa TaxID=163714 RepID=A0A7R8W8H3_9CRUS|nr:unnamed protein product [Cyprideis torosa]CAG0887512.1 unnamed protein product [Cyprideis torosa]